MQILKKRLKDKGFILIITLILIIFIMGNFLLGYRIIYRRGERLSSDISSISINSQVNNLKVLAYDELLRIDTSISSGEYKNGSEYIGTADTYGRVWFGNTKNNYGQTGYQLHKMKFNNSTCYIYTPEKYQNFKEIILINLSSSPMSDNYLDVELTKKLTTDNNDQMVVFTAIVQLKYKKGNRNPTAPDAENLKEFVVNFESKNTQ